MWWQGGRPNRKMRRMYVPCRTWPKWSDSPSSWRKALQRRISHVSTRLTADRRMSGDFKAAHLAVSQPVSWAVQWSSPSWWWRRTASLEPQPPGPTSPPGAWWRSSHSAQRQHGVVSAPPKKRCNPHKGFYPVPPEGAVLPSGGWWACCTTGWRPRRWASGRYWRWPPRAGSESAEQVLSGFSMFTVCLPLLLKKEKKKFWLILANFVTIIWNHPCCYLGMLSSWFNFLRLYNYWCFYIQRSHSTLDNLIRYSYQLSIWRLIMHITMFPTHRGFRTIFISAAK